MKGICPATTSSDNAFYTKSSRNNLFPKQKKKFKPRCYNCNELGHTSNYCNKPKHLKGDKEKESLSSNFLSLYRTLNSQKLNQPTDWFVDSGCNAHMSLRNYWMNDLNTETNRMIDVANSSVIPVHIP